MRKSKKMRAVEDRYNLPIDSILRDELLRLGSQDAVAKSLGVHQSTISLWLLRCGLQLKKVTTPIIRD